jgi:2-keto-4-pentenoate hydratase/2-oxohepta-3-ene-1,7-dioic acid hydratase in catechol pathway
MRYATFSIGGDPTPRLGVADDTHVVDVQALAAPLDVGAVPGTLEELVSQGPEAWERMAEILRAELPRYGGERHAFKDIQWHAPIPRPGKNVFCVGRNYKGHIEESARARGEAVKLPEVPVIFTKAPTAVTGPFDVISYERSVTKEVDWEAELGVVIGVGGRNIPRSEALRHVFGYTVINDVSARDLQKNHLQFFKGKSLDTFCPMGPIVVTADEFGDPQRKDVTLRVNGVEKQHGNTRDMIFTVAVIIEWLSKGLTIEPGDIIATGTPDGVGFSRTPPEFLLDGDVLETEIEGIGTMRNVFSVRP